MSFTRVVFCSISMAKIVIAFFEGEESKKEENRNKPENETKHQ